MIAKLEFKNRKDISKKGGNICLTPYIGFWWWNTKCSKYLRLGLRSGWIIWELNLELEI